MIRGGWRAGFIAIVGVVGCLIASAAGTAGANDREVDAVLKRLDAVQLPVLDRNRRGDEAYTRTFVADRDRATRERNALIAELFRLDPDATRIPALMAERWSVRASGLTADEVEREVAAVLADPARPLPLRIEATFAQAFTRLYDSKGVDPAVLALVEGFHRVAPRDPRNATLWQRVGSQAVDPAVQRTWEDRILAEFPDSAEARRIRGVAGRADLLGRVLDLEFVDAIGGEVVSLSRLRGRVVVLDFWATWCAPCVAEVPRLRELNARYQPRGVAFVGVSLDGPLAEGGREALRRFCRAQGVTWPQCHQGQGWESPFAVACGVRAIPDLFVLDTEGRVAAIVAVADLDRWLARLAPASTAAPVEPTAAPR